MCLILSKHQLQRRPKVLRVCQTESPTLKPDKNRLLHAQIYTSQNIYDLKLPYQATEHNQKHEQDQHITAQDDILLLSNSQFATADWSGWQDVGSDSRIPKQGLASFVRQPQGCPTTYTTA